MAYAEFTDPDGRLWRVWETRPQSPELLTNLPREWATGWLTFESPPMKLRLAPVPDGWERLPPERLDLLRRLAQPLPPASAMDDTFHREEDRPR